MQCFSKIQLIIIITLGGCNFLSAIIYSLQAPFYPAEAEKKGASTTFAGVVLGVYELTGFLACPLVSSTVLRRFGPYICFHIGILTTGTTTLLFGFLNRINDTATFVSLSLLLRVLESFGAATTFVSSYGFLNVVFPNNIGTAFAILETMFAVGMAAGPPIGEALFELGLNIGSEEWGFTTPFLGMGFVFYTITLITTNTLKPMRSRPVGNMGLQESSVSSEKDQERSEGFVSFMRVPNIFIFYLTLVVESMSFGFQTCTLEPHIRQFQLSPLQTGGMFLIFGGVYAGTASLWGILCDKIKRPIIVTLVGTFLTIVAFTFMGPSILIPIKPSVALTGVSLAVFGLGVGAVYVSCFLLMLNEAKLQGFPETHTLSASISALWLSGMHFGSFIGPILGGFLFEKFGFPIESFFIVVLCVIISTLLFFVFVKRSVVSHSIWSSSTSIDPENSETQPLLPNKKSTL